MVCRDGGSLADMGEPRDFTAVKDRGHVDAHRPRIIDSNGRSCCGGLGDDENLFEILIRRVQILANRDDVTCLVGFDGVDFPGIGEHRPAGRRPESLRHRDGAADCVNAVAAVVAVIRLSARGSAGGEDAARTGIQTAAARVGWDGRGFKSENIALVGRVALVVPGRERAIAVFPMVVINRGIVTAHRNGDHIVHGIGNDRIVVDIDQNGAEILRETGYEIFRFARGNFRLNGLAGGDRGYQEQGENRESGEDLPQSPVSRVGDCVDDALKERTVACTPNANRFTAKLGLMIQSLPG
jgi:hypothetical protein